MQELGESLSLGSGHGAPWGWGESWAKGEVREDVRDVRIIGYTTHLKCTNNFMGSSSQTFTVNTYVT